MEHEGQPPSAGHRATVEPSASIPKAHDNDPATMREIAESAGFDHISSTIEEELRRLIELQNRAA